MGIIKWLWRRLVGAHASLVRSPDDPYAFHIVIFRSRWQRTSTDSYTFIPIDRGNPDTAHPRAAIDKLQELLRKKGYRTEVQLLGQGIHYMEGM